jgi:hypothetical protein
VTVAVAVAVALVLGSFVVNDPLRVMIVDADDRRWWWFLVEFTRLVLQHRLENC